VLQNVSIKSLHLNLVWFTSASLSRKKLSTFSQNPNWKNASNYVAKRYMKEAGRETYFDDVKLQMDSKLWGEEYSKLSVPKKVSSCGAW
jgi:hypothetical protein